MRPRPDERAPRRALAALLAALVAGAAARADAPAHPPLIEFLNDVVRWFHAQEAAAGLAGDPADVVFADAVRRQARQVLQLAFAFGRADAALQPAAAPAGGADDRMEALLGRADQAAAAVQQAQAAVDDVQRQLQAASTAAARAVLRERLAEARSELQLASARRDTLNGFVDFMNQAGLGTGGAAGLLGQVEELERSVPEAGATVPAAPTAAAPAARGAPAGIASLVSEAVGLSRKLRQLHADDALTARLRVAADRLRTPLGDELRSTLQRADRLSQAPAGDDPAALGQRAQALDQLTTRFKAVSGALVPLGKLSVLLDAHRAVLAQWSAAVDGQWDAALRALLLHLGLLALAIAAILAASASWRRGTFRYVHDPRRRQQSLLLRRIVVGAAIALTVVFSLVTEVGSLATFAGFVTAGLAVALQNVILSVAAYFFLIGRYGVRVGDRVQIGGVTGDVLDIGLVRLHLMELGGEGLPTGRVVVFSNAVLFQPTASFFKQIPGSDFTWHQLTLTLSPDTDYRHAERRLLSAVEGVHARYRDRIARAHARMTQDLSVPVRDPEPQSQIRLTQAGLEMTIRFPAPLDVPSIDDEVARALLEAVEREPRLKLVGSATPTIQAVPHPASA